jgi:PRC-barrel domain
MSIPRCTGRKLRWLALGSAGWMTLLALSACATGAAGQRPGVAPAPAATSPPSPTATAAAAPDAPAATGGSPGSAEPPPAVETSPPPPEPPPAPTAPASPASGASTASSASSASSEEKMLPPCVPVRRVRPKHHRPKRAPAPQTPAAIGPPAPPPADAVVDAQVGEVGTSLGPILGRDVKSPKGEDLGRVVDVLADSQGHVRVAIIDFGGFLGVGTRRIAVDWPLLRFDLSARDKPLILSVDRQKLQSAPEYNSNKPRVLIPPAAPDDAPDTGQTKK